MRELRSLSVGEYVDGNIGRRIVDEAEARDCDHLFLLGRKRRRFGSIFSRDAVRDALDEFDGFATVGRETDPEKRIARLADRDAETDDFVEFYRSWT